MNEPRSPLAERNAAGAAGAAGPRGAKGTEKGAASPPPAAPAASAPRPHPTARAAGAGALGLENYAGVRERVRQLKDREKKAIRAKKAARELELLQMEQLREEFELERREYERQIDGLRKRARDTGDRLAQLRATYDRDTKQLAAKADATLVRKETAMKKLKEKAHGEVQTLQGAMREQVEALQAELKRQAAAHDAEKAELVRRHQGVQAAAREEHRAELQALKDKHVGNLKEVMVSEEAWKVRSEELAAAEQQACARIGDLEEEVGKKAEIAAALESSLADLAGEGRSRRRRSRRTRSTSSGSCGTRRRLPCGTRSGSGMSWPRRSTGRPRTSPTWRRSCAPSRRRTSRSSPPSAGGRRPSWRRRWRSRSARRRRGPRWRTAGSGSWRRRPPPTRSRWAS